MFVLLIVIASLVIWYQHEPAEGLKKVQLVGQTMGTTYTIKYLEPRAKNYKNSIDSLLVKFNESLSTYIPTSEISSFNDTTAFSFQLPFFLPVLTKSKSIFEASSGAFDPTVGPLVNVWGFGPQTRMDVDSVLVDSLLAYVGFDQIEFDSSEVRKPSVHHYVDFSAIAKGYGVDVVSEFLKSNGIENYFVEIGGEIRCRGKNDNGQIWRVGINKPSENSEIASELQAIIKLKNRGLATSGNYRNFYEKDGLKYAHTISPFTGFPVEHTLLSATVVADDCMTADAWATAFMVMGLDQAKSIIEESEEIESYLIYSGEVGDFLEYVSPGLETYFEGGN